MRGRFARFARFFAHIVWVPVESVLVERVQVEVAHLGEARRAAYSRYYFFLKEQHAQKIPGPRKAIDIYRSS